MFRFTFKKVAALTVLVVASLAIATPGHAAYALSASPTYKIYSSTFCNFYSGGMMPIFAVDGANLDLYLVEKQRIYVQLALYSSVKGFIYDPTYYYGDSIGQDNSFRESWDHVGEWFNAYTNQSQGSNLTIYNRGRGTYAVGMRFAWDRSSSGAASSSSQLPAANHGWTDWIWFQGTCTW